MQYTYEEVLNKIESARRFGNLPGVDVMEHMLSVLGQPMEGLPYIHVAGTNGKGSVCAFLDSILRALGLKVGRFTSPHLMDFRERITVNGQMIGRDEVQRLGNELLSQNFTVCPTMFDYCLAMAVLYFRRQQCDLAVMETGLGGRLDSTNALGTPEAAVITRIGYDHTAILGNTLTEIAAEKAGILKPNVPAVFGLQEPEVMDVLLSHYYSMPQTTEPYLVSRADVRRMEGCPIGLFGAYQLENAAAAEAAVWQVWKKHQGGTDGTLWSGYTAEDVQEAVDKGLRTASWPGRMEILSDEPFFMVDGAHNSSGVKALTQSLAHSFPHERFHFVIGVMADKDYREMITLLLPLAIDFVTVTPESERALDKEALADYIRSKKVPARALQSMEEVPFLLAAGERTVALGSLYFIGDVKRLWELGYSFYN